MRGDSFYVILLQRWSLPPESQPSDLPLGTDTRGLFQISPQYEYLPGVRTSNNEIISVRRTGFYLVPADTITVYAAQGATYDAVVVDMERPPRMSSEQQWLACYVMLSRAKSLEGFAVLRPATRITGRAGREWGWGGRWWGGC